MATLQFVQVMLFLPYNAVLCIALETCSRTTGGLILENDKAWTLIAFRGIWLTCVPNKFTSTLTHGRLNLFFGTLLLMAKFSESLE